MRKEKANENGILKI